MVFTEVFWKFRIGIGLSFRVIFFLTVFRCNVVLPYQRIVIVLFCRYVYFVGLFPFLSITSLLCISAYLFVLLSIYFSVCIYIFGCSSLLLFVFSILLLWTVCLCYSLLHLVFTLSLYSHCKTGLGSAEPEVGLETKDTKKIVELETLLQCQVKKIYIFSPFLNIQFPFC